MNELLFWYNTLWFIGIFSLGPFVMGVCTYWSIKIKHESFAHALSVPAICTGLMIAYFIFVYRLEFIANELAMLELQRL